ncbi:MAG: GntR family transcriptional regulator, partial [Thermotoga sp. 4484_232]
MDKDRLTIRRALEELRREGIIERTKGRGTFITGSKKEEQLTVLRGFTDEARNKGYRVRSKVLENKLIEVPVEARDAFKLEPKTLVVLLKRLRYINDEPVAIEWAYLNPNVSVKILNVLKEDMSRRSLYEFLREEVGLVLSRAIEVLEIVDLTEEDARLLEVPQKSCAVLRKRFTYTSKNECVEYVLSLYR